LTKWDGQYVHFDWIQSENKYASQYHKKGDWGKDSNGKDIIPTDDDVHWFSFYVGAIQDPYETYVNKYS